MHLPILSRYMLNILYNVMIKLADGMRGVLYEFFAFHSLNGVQVRTIPPLNQIG